MKNSGKSLFPYASHCLVAALLLTGCSTTGNVDGSFGGGTGPGGGDVLTVKTAPLSRNGEVPNSIEVEGFDAKGNQVFGPLDLPYTGGADVNIQGLPPTTAHLQLDFLRNDSIGLFRNEVDITRTSGTIVLPAPLTPAQQTSSYKYLPQGTGFALQETVDGVPINKLPGTLGKSEQTLKLKGVCYSPAPINYSNKDAPGFGDLFWDTYKDQNNNSVFNWEGLWRAGSLGYKDFKGRDDLNRIRALGCNSLRTYCTIARQIGTDGKVPGPSTGNLFTHKQFLDLCWNKGNKPLRVLIGIPMPPENYYQYSKDTTNFDFWEANLKDTVTDLKDHPAVLGFVIFNEIDEDRSAWTHGANNRNYTPNSDSDYYYGQIKKYSALCKQIAPGKLVGWAAHEAPNFVEFGRTAKGLGVNPRITAGVPYFEQLPDIDFYGVNSYQTSILTPLLGTDPVRDWGSFELLQGAARKPVVFTELGWPATGHKDPGDSDSIYEDATTRSNTAKVISDMVPKAFKSSDLTMGVFYFEYCDEWWKQDTSQRAAHGNKYTWNGTPSQPVGFPNGYWDEEGFGLFSLRKGAGLKPDQDPWNGFNGPTLPQDDQIERTEMTRALKDAFNSI